MILRIILSFLALEGQPRRRYNFIIFLGRTDPFCWLLFRSLHFECHPRCRAPNWDRPLWPFNHPSLFYRFFPLLCLLLFYGLQLWFANLIVGDQLFILVQVAPLFFGELLWLLEAHFLDISQCILVALSCFMLLLHLRSPLKLFKNFLRLNKKFKNIFVENCEKDLLITWNYTIL